MITRLKVQNYKSLSSVEMKDLRRIVLIGGDNNVGKTNLLEALFTLHLRNEPKMTIRHWGLRGIPMVPNEARSFLAPLFHKFDMTRTVVIEKEEENGKVESLRLSVRQQDAVETTFAESATETRAYMPMPMPSIDVELDTDGSRSCSKYDFAVTPAGLQVKITDQLPACGPAAFIVERGGMSSEEECVHFGRVDREKRVGELVKALSVLEKDVKSLSVIPMGDKNVIHADLGFAEKVPLRLSGGGTVRLLQFLLGIAVSPESSALLDEVDSGFHFSIKERVFASLAEAAARYDCQLFCTTHSYECLGKAVAAFKGKFQNDFCYIRLEKGEDRILAKYYDYDALAAAIENNWEIR